MATCFGDSYVEVIERTECIGNSLAKINNNFAALDLRLCEASNTTSTLDGLLGIIKGNGNGGFLVADPDEDYYVPGRILNKDLKVLGKFECSGNMTIGEGSIVVNQGNVSCVNLYAIGTGSFGGSVGITGSLTIEGRGTFKGEVEANSLTVDNAAILNSTLEVGGIFTGTSIVCSSAVRVPMIIVPGNPTFATTGSPGTITAPNIIGTYSLIVPQLTSTALYTDKAIVQALTAEDGTFTGYWVEAAQARFLSLSSTNANISNAYSTFASTTQLSAKTANIVENVTTQIINVTTAKCEKIEAQEIEAKKIAPGGNDISFIKAAEGRFTNVNATSAVNAVRFEASGLNAEIKGPTGNITTVNATTVTGSTITATTKLKSDGGLECKSILVNTQIQSPVDGLIQTNVKVKAPLGEFDQIKSEFAGNVNSPNLHLSHATDCCIKIDGNNAKFVMNGTSAELSVLNGTITAKRVTASSEIKCDGDIIAYQASDRRLKKNITQISNSLEKVSKINGVDFDWDTKLQSVHEGADTGVIAQEVEEIMPTAVTTRENGYKAVKYDRLIPLLIEAVKELKEQNVSLKEELDLLKSNKCCKCK